MRRPIRTSYVTVSVDVDVDDVLADVSDQELIEELALRDAATHRDTVRTVIQQIQRGDTLDAITTLEREFFPKWASVEASRQQYALAVKAAPGGPAGEVG